MWIISKIYPYRLSQRIHSLRDILYTLCIRNIIGQVGKHSTIACPCTLQGEGQKKIAIGDGLLTGRFVYIGDNAHGGLSWEESSVPPINRQLRSKGEVKIGLNVWIGDKVTILGGVTIGDNVIIAANAVVTKDVPSNSIAAGIPAKVVKTLELCQNLD